MRSTLLFISIMITVLSGYSQSAKTGLFDLSTVKVSEISVNTIRSDFGPAVIGDSLYFSSFRDEVIDKPDKQLKVKEFYDLFNAGIDQYGNVISGRKAVEEFITRFHDGPVSWCAKTGELFITQSNYVDPSVRYKPFRSEDIKLRIVISKKVNNKWTVVEEFPYNNADYSIGQPAINETGDTLYFASDMPGGFGATDIYMSVRKNEKWNAPVNMGNQINTSEKDEFPFITGNSYPERYLIFASKGHSSMGGFDLFYKKLKDPNSEINQFPEPINSTSDDFAMILPSNVEYGYMTSNRPGTGNDDIYKIIFDKDVDYLQKIFVRDSKTLQPISGANINFCDKKKDTTNVKGEASHLFKKNTACKVSVSAFGYKEKSLVVSIKAPMPGTILRDTISMDMIVNEKIVLKNIYYDFDKWDILPASAIELDRVVSFTKGNPQLKVVLSSHTDARGSRQYNQKLSQLRAQSAIDYIISKGIDQSKVTGVGYGESQLINDCKDFVKCTPEQQRENRRTELFIPGFLTGEAVPQEFGDYSDGSPDHKQGYSSTKAHGSVYGQPVHINLAAAPNMDYYLILGSFKDKVYADKFVEMLKSEGYETIVIADSDTYRVGNKYNYYSQAKRALDDLASKSHIGWILKGK